MSVEDSWFTVSKATGKKVQTKRHGRGKRWRVRNRGARTVSFDKRSDADAYDTQAKGELLKGVTPLDRAAGRITFREYAGAWVADRYPNANSRRTVDSWLTMHIIPTFGPRELRAIEASTVNAWLVSLRKTTSRTTKRPLAANTQVHIYTLLASIMKSAVVDRRVIVSPCDTSDTPASTRPPKRLAWPADRVHGLVDAMPDRDHGIGLLGAMAGFRQGEAFAVSTEDVDVFGRRVFVRHQVQRVGGRLTLVPPKFDSKRTVPLDAVTLQALRVHLDRYPTLDAGCECCPGQRHALLFHTAGHPLAHKTWNQRVWHPALRAVGVEPAGKATGFHQLRHHYVSQLVDGGASLLDVRDMVGHKSTATTEQVYGHLFEHSHDKVRAIMERSRTVGNAAQPLPMSSVAGAYPLRTQQDQ